MEDFTFVLSVAFSGTDLTRALWIGLVGSLFVTKKFQPTRMALLLFVIDRAWPFAGMALSGYDMPAIAASLAYAFEMLPRDATFYVIRFGGLFALCSFGYHLRMAIHRGAPAKNRLPVPY
ncbi:MAG: hypothetical protein AAGA69_12590 [Pseudomonadota bacterium]